MSLSLYILHKKIELLFNVRRCTWTYYNTAACVTGNLKCEDVNWFTIIYLFCLIEKRRLSEKNLCLLNLDRLELMYILYRPCNVYRYMYNCTLYVYMLSIRFFRIKFHVFVIESHNAMKNKSYLKLKKVRNPFSLIKTQRPILN